MLCAIPTPAHAGWFSSISNYFNQPTKNSLVATTAVAGTALLATFFCAWNWWKARRSNETLNQQKEALRYKALNDVRSAELISQARTNRLLEAAQGKLKHLNSQHLAFKTHIVGTLTETRTQASAEATKANQEHARVVEQLQANLKDKQFALERRQSDHSELLAEYHSHKCVREQLEKDNAKLAAELAQIKKSKNASLSASAFEFDATN